MDEKSWSASVTQLQMTKEKVVLQIIIQWMLLICKVQFKNRAKKLKVAVGPVNTSTVTLTGGFFFFFKEGVTTRAAIDLNWLGPGPTMHLF